MHMVLDAADEQSGTVPCLEDAGLVSIEVVANVLGNPRLAVFCAVDKMEQVLDQGLRHIADPVLRPFRADEFFDDRHQGVALG